MRILCDYHHAGLFNSFKIIAKNLNAEIYRPYGRDWYREGFWGVGEPYNNPEDVITQYLGPTNDCLTIFIPDLAHSSEDHIIGFNYFKAIKFDVIICSISQHIQKFKVLRDLYQPQAKLIWQQGNPGYLVPPFDAYPNILDSVGQVEDFVKPNGVHYLKYHQPFELDIFHPVDAKTSPRKIKSFVLSPEKIEIWRRIRNAFNDQFITFESYGYSVHGADFQPVSGIQNIAALMQDSRAAWHVKSIDGYGHIIHNWFACGKPVFTFFSDYQGKIAHDLMVDGLTAFDLGAHSESDIIDIIDSLCYDNDYYESVSNAVTKRFNEIVDFNQETELLRKFFENLV